jgi:Winged helix-turn helix
MIFFTFATQGEEMDRDRIRSQDDTPKNLWGGRRHCAMTIDEEREFLAQWIDKATIGGALTVPPIHASLVKRLCRDIPMSTTYRLLARHNSRKVQPDTKHPKSDPALQDEFKKISRSGGSRLSEKGYIFYKFYRKELCACHTG